MHERMKHKRTQQIRRLRIMPFNFEAGHTPSPYIVKPTARSITMNPQYHSPPWRFSHLQRFAEPPKPLIWSLSASLAFKRLLPQTGRQPTSSVFLNTPSHKTSQQTLHPQNPSPDPEAACPSPFLHRHVYARMDRCTRG